jgi:septal ring factor EnvC (AmiA/AmiB activator)
MQFIWRDAAWLTVVLLLLACLWFEHRLAASRQQRSDQIQQELSAALQKQTELAATVDQLRTQLDDYENHGGLIRRFLLLHLERK